MTSDMTSALRPVVDKMLARQLARSARGAQAAARVSRRLSKAGLWRGVSMPARIRERGAGGHFVCVCERSC